MAVYPYRFSSDPSLKPKGNSKKEDKKMACKSKKSTSKKCGKKGGK